MTVHKGQGATEGQVDHDSQAAGSAVGLWDEWSVSLQKKGTGELTAKTLH